MKHFLIPAIILMFILSPVVAQQQQAETYSEYTDSVVSVKVSGESGNSIGTGFVYGSRYVVTNNHVVELENSSRPDRVQVRFEEDGEWRDAGIAVRSPETDLAVLRIDEVPEGIDGLNLSVSEPYLGQQVGVIGNSYGMGDSIVTGQVTDLEYSTTTRQGVTLEDAIQVSAAIESGYSGGPVLTVEGEVLGVIGARKLESKTGLAIPASKLREVVSELVEANQTN